ncbi:uncharacterized protein LOC115215042 [Argonauta hians]
MQTAKMATTLSAREQAMSLQQTAKRQKKKAVKSVLITPFNTHWPSIPHEDEQKILGNLKKILLPIYHKKSEQPGIAERQAMQTQYIIGLNAVTRHLEKNLLCLVITCGSARPKHITQHIAELSAIRGCPAVAVKNLGKTVASALNISSCMTIGFKKCVEGKSYFKEFISSVKAPKISLPFMNDYVAQHANVLTEINNSNQNAKMSQSQKRDPPNEPVPTKGQCLASSSSKASNSDGQTTNLPTDVSFSHLYLRKSAKQLEKSLGKKAFDPKLDFIFLGCDSDDDDEGDGGGVEEKNEKLESLLCVYNRGGSVKNMKWEEIFVPNFMPDHLWGKSGVGMDKPELKEDDVDNSDKKMVGDVKTEGKGKGKSKKRKPEAIEYADTIIKKVKGNSEKKSKKIQKPSKRTAKHSKTVKNKGIKK